MTGSKCLNYDIVAFDLRQYSAFITRQVDMQDTVVGLALQIMPGLALVLRF